MLLESYISQEYESCSQDTLFESIKLLDDTKHTVDNIKDLYDQWKKTTDKFVNKKWIYRYTDEKQRDALKKHWDNLVDPNVYYSVYKRSFKAICKFMGLPHDEVILEWIRFTKDEVDKGQLKVSVRYSRGKVKVKIPKGVRLIHVSPVGGIKSLMPTFRSKSVGKYMYPSKRVFFSLMKETSSFKSGNLNKKSYKYTTSDEFEYAYIDPTYSSFSEGCVYIETDSPIGVISLDRWYEKMIKKLGFGKKPEKED